MLVQLKTRHRNYLNQHLPRYLIQLETNLRPSFTEFFRPRGNGRHSCCAEKAVSWTLSFVTDLHICDYAIDASRWPRPSQYTLTVDALLHWLDELDPPALGTDRTIEVRLSVSSGPFLTIWISTSNFKRK